MAYYRMTMGDMVRQVISIRRGIDPLLVQRFINQRIREVTAQRPWSDLIDRRIVQIPDMYSAGRVNVSNGSRLVYGVDTNWPTNDVVNTTITNDVSELGFVEIYPADMTGITAESVLVLDADGDYEVVPVIELRQASCVVGPVSKTHSAGAKLWQSSLAGRQFRTHYGDPYYTVRGVLGPTLLCLDHPWAGDTGTGRAYEIVKAYISLGPDVAFVMCGYDPKTWYPVRIGVSQQELNWKDPQRSATGHLGVVEISELGPSETGTMLYEVWPVIKSRTELVFLVARAWPNMSERDYSPPFIDPQVFICGAVADALRVRVREDDPWFNPQLASVYESKAMQLLTIAQQADEAKVMQQLRFFFNRFPGPPLDEYDYYWGVYQPRIGEK